MNELLQFIMNYCESLYTKYNFKFVDSDYCEGDNSYITLRNEDIDLMFLRDRSQLFLHVYSKYDPEKENYYSLDLVRQLLTGEKEYYSLLDENNGIFLHDNMLEILKLFKRNLINDTLLKLNVLQEKRTKKLWG